MDCLLVLSVQSPLLTLASQAWQLLWKRESQTSRAHKFVHLEHEVVLEEQHHGLARNTHDIHTLYILNFSYTHNY